MQLLESDDPSTDMRSWSNSEIIFLKEKFPTMDTVYIAKEMGRTVSSIQAKAFKLWLKKTKKHLKLIGLG